MTGLFAVICIIFLNGFVGAVASSIERAKASTTIMAELAIFVPGVFFSFVFLSYMAYIVYCTMVDAGKIIPSEKVDASSKANLSEPVA